MVTILKHNARLKEFLVLEGTWFNLTFPILDVIRGKFKQTDQIGFFLTYS